MSEALARNHLLGRLRKIDLYPVGKVRSLNHSKFAGLIWLSTMGFCLYSHANGSNLIGGIIMRRARIGLLTITGIAVAAAFGLSPAAAQSVEEFYQMRQMTLVVSTTASGGYDIYARTFARSFPRHMPANPTIIVQNMPGAGGLRATNYLYEKAAKDGAVIATIHSSMMTAPLLGIEQANFDVLFKDTLHPIQAGEIEVGDRVLVNPARQFGKVIRRFGNALRIEFKNGHIGSFWEIELEKR